MQQVHDSPYRQTLRDSIWDGVCFSVMFGLGESYLAAFGVFLNATSFQIGILGALPLFMGALSQLIGVHIMELGVSRRRLILVTAFIQSLFWIPIAAIHWVLPPGTAAVSVLTALVVIYYSFGQFNAPIWISLIGDLVPPEVRGRYFGRRNTICGCFLIVSLIAGGTILETARLHHMLEEAFTLIFSVSLIARLVSCYFLSRHADPDFVLDPQQRFTFFQFIRRIRTSNFARYSVFHALTYFSVFLATPFFTVYMLTELQFSYVEFTAVIVTGVGANFLFMNYWGPQCDRYGSKQVLSICSAGGALAPLLWVFSHNLWYLILIQLFGGFVWAGFQLAANNFLFDAVTPPKRGRCAAYVAVLTSSGILLGSFMGGWLIDWRDGVLLLGASGGLFSSPFLALFFLSGLIRSVVTVSFLSRFNEVRPVEDFGRPLILRVRGVHPTISGLNWGLAAIRGGRKHFKRSNQNG